MQYGIKKKEVPVVTEDPGLEGRLGRKKKTPEELAAEANTDPEEAAAQSRLKITRIQALLVIRRIDIINAVSALSD